MIKLQRQPAGPDVIRVPGGKPMAKLVATSRIPHHHTDHRAVSDSQPDEPNKPLAFLKIVGGTTALVLIGVWIYVAAKRKTAATG